MQGKRRLFRSEFEGGFSDFKHITKLGVIGVAIIVFAVPDLLRWAEPYMNPNKSEWIRPEILIFRSDNNEPVIMYSTATTHAVDARFIVQTRKISPRGQVICTGASPNEFRYSPTTGIKKPWGWGAWTLGLCDEPVVPFVACLRYVGRGVHGTPFDTPWTCSNRYAP